MWSKEAFLGANITFCVRAAWRDPWCFLEGIFFQLNAWWKSWQSRWQNATEWWNMSLRYLQFWGSKAETSRDRRREMLRLWLLFPFYLFIFKPQGWSGGNERRSRYLLNSTQSEWHHAKIPKQVISSVWGKQAIRPSTCRLQHKARRQERRRGMHQGMFDLGIKQRWLMRLRRYKTDLLQLKDNN